MSGIESAIPFEPGSVWRCERCGASKPVVVRWTSPVPCEARASPAEVRRRRKHAASNTASISKSCGGQMFVHPPAPPLP